MDDEAEYVCSATLMVLGDGLIPQRITELLGLEPGQSWSKLGGSETRAARLAFAGGAFTPPLTKGRYAPLETQLIRTDSSPPQAVGHSQVLRKGERKSFVRHDGARHYFDSRHEQGGWKCFIPDEKRNAEFAEQLAWWCDALEGREPALRALEAQGLRLQVDCFVGARESATLELSADLQGRLSRLRLNLTVCFSAEAPSTGGEAEQATAADPE